MAQLLYIWPPCLVSGVPNSINICLNTLVPQTINVLLKEGSRNLFEVSSTVSAPGVHTLRVAGVVGNAAVDAGVAVFSAGPPQTAPLLVVPRAVAHDVSQLFDSLVRGRLRLFGQASLDVQTQNRVVGAVYSAQMLPLLKDLLVIKEAAAVPFGHVREACARLVPWCHSHELTNILVWVRTLLGHQAGMPVDLLAPLEAPTRLPLLQYGAFEGRSSTTAAGPLQNPSTGGGVPASSANQHASLRHRAMTAASHAAAADAISAGSNSSQHDKVSVISLGGSSDVFLTTFLPDQHQHQPHRPPGAATEDRDRDSPIQSIICSSLDATCFLDASPVHSTRSHAIASSLDMLNLSGGFISSSPIQPGASSPIQPVNSLLPGGSSSQGQESSQDILQLIDCMSLNLENVSNPNSGGKEDYLLTKQATDSQAQWMLSTVPRDSGPSLPQTAELSSCGSDVLCARPQPDPPTRQPAPGSGGPEELSINTVWLGFTHSRLEQVFAADLAQQCLMLEWLWAGLTVMVFAFYGPGNLSGSTPESLLLLAQMLPNLVTSLLLLSSNLAGSTHRAALLCTTRLITSASHVLVALSSLPMPSYIIKVATSFPQRLLVFGVLKVIQRPLLFRTSFVLTLAESACLALPLARVLPLAVVVPQQLCVWYVGVATAACVDYALRRVFLRSGANQPERGSSTTEGAAPAAPSHDGSRNSNGSSRSSKSERRNHNMLRTCTMAALQGFSHASQELAYSSWRGLQCVWVDVAAVMLFPLLAALHLNVVGVGVGLWMCVGHALLHAAALALPASSRQLREALVCAPVYMLVHMLCWMWSLPLGAQSSGSSASLASGPTAAIADVSASVGPAAASSSSSDMAGSDQIFLAELVVAGVILPMLLQARFKAVLPLLVWRFLYDVVMVLRGEGSAGDMGLLLLQKADILVLSGLLVLALDCIARKQYLKCISASRTSTHSK